MGLTDFITKYRFLDPSQVLPAANIAKGSIIADLGCGNGYFPAAAAKIVGSSGQVYAVDISDSALEATNSAAKRDNLKNVYTIKHDLSAPGLKIADNSCDAVILGGILHLPDLRKSVLRETYRILKTGGKVIAIEWKKIHLPFGPQMNNRIAESELHEMLTKSGFKFNAEIPTDHFHYSLMYVK